MKANREKLTIAMARACMNTEDLIEATQMPRPTVTNVITGRNITPKTLGKIARALGVDVLEIIESI